MNRRQSLGLTMGGFAAGALAACGGTLNNAVARESEDKSTIVMIHGAWHWSGCFQKVATTVAASGHPVILPDLKSHGYSPATYDQVASMADYVAPVAAILENATSPVVLLGHSMGGASLTYLAEKYPARIRKLIYLTAYMTPSGKSANDYIFSSSYTNDPAVASLLKILNASPDGKGVVLHTDRPDLVKDAFYGDCSTHDITVAAANIVSTNSNVPFAAQTVTTAANFGSIPRVFIECTEDHAIPIAQQRKMQADVPGATVMTLRTSHSSFFSDPDELAGLILKAAN